MPGDDQHPAPRPRHLVLWCAAGLIVLQGVLRGWSALRGFYYADDFLALDAAMSHRLDDLGYLTRSVGTQLSPGAVAGSWLVARLMPLQWVPVTLVTLVLQAALSTAFLALLLRLFGRPPAILVPLALVTLSPLSLPATLWWSSALSYLPAMLSGVLALVLLVDHLRSGTTRPAVLSATLFGVALLFSERALLLVMVAQGIVLCWFTRGPLLARLRSLVTQYRWVSLPPLVVVVTYAVGYLSTVPSPFPLPRVPGYDVASALTGAVFQGLIPALVGGPYTWTPVGDAGALADPSAFVVALTGALVLATVGLTSWFTLRAGRAWALLGVCLLVELGLLLLSGYLVFGEAAGLDLRHVRELAVIAPLMLAFATIPVAGDWALPPLEAPQPRPGAADRLEQAVLHPLHQAGALGPSASPGTIAAVVALAVVVPGAVWSHVAYDPWWTHNPAKPWVETAAPVARELPDRVLVASTFVPDHVVSGLLYPANESVRVLSPALRADRVLAGDRATNQLVVFDDEGILRLAGVLGARGSGGLEGPCGWRLGEDDVTVRLSQSVQAAAPVLRLGFVTGETMALPVTAGNAEVNLPITPGLGAAFIRVPAGIDRVTFHRSSTGGTLCSNDLTVGAVVAVPGSAP